MRILFDTNIILDFLCNREPFSSNANALIELCDTGEITGYIAAHTIPNVFFILRKQYTVDERKSFLIDLFDIFTIVGINSQILLSSLRNADFSDIEDCMQYECAKEINADYIVTRDPNGFPCSMIPAIDPTDLLKLLNTDET